MNEQVINNVISDFAMENANLRLTVATLRAQLEDLKALQNTEEKGEVK